MRPLRVSRIPLARHNMAEIVEYNVTLPMAARLADLAGIQADLERVVAYCARMVARYAGSHLAETPFDIVGFTTPIDFDDWEALSTASAIAYGRCFASGVRSRLTPLVPEMQDPAMRELHEFLIEFRNKHVAHSVNAFEENSVGVHVSSDYTSSADILTIVPRHTRQSGFQIDMPSSIRRLAEWWQQQVQDAIDVERLAVLRALQAVPLEEIRKMGVFVSEERRVDARRRSL